MKRPRRIAGVVATTTLLMATAALGIVAIQQAVAESMSVNVVASAPVLVSRAPAATAVNPADVLGDVQGSEALPPIPVVKASTVPPTTPAPATQNRPQTRRTTAPRATAAKPTESEKGHSSTRATSTQSTGEHDREQAKQAAEQAAEQAKKAAELAAEQAKQNAEDAAEDHSDEQSSFDD